MDVEELRRLFQYPRGWLQHGFVTEQQLRRQWEEWQADESPHAEHYRYGAFKEWLASRDRVTDEELTAWMRLIDEDPEELMANAMIIDLLYIPRLTVGQFEKLQQRALRLDDPWFQRHRVRSRVLHRLTTAPADEEARLLLSTLSPEELRRVSLHASDASLRKEAAERLRAAGERGEGWFPAL